MKPQYIFSSIALFWASMCGPLSRRGGKMVINDLWSELLIFALQFCGFKLFNFFTIVGDICEEFQYVLSSGVLTLKNVAYLFAYFICLDSNLAYPCSKGDEDGNWDFLFFSCIDFSWRKIYVPPMNIQVLWLSIFFPQIFFWWFLDHFHHSFKEANLLKLICFCSRIWLQQ